MTALNRYFEGVTPYLLLVFLGCWLGGIFDGMDSSLYVVVQHDALADLLGTTDRTRISTVGSWVVCLFLLGWTLGGMAIGVISDRLGRVKAMVLSIALYAIFTGLCGLAQTWWQLGIFRFLTGFGIGGELVTIATMLSETWPERSRALAIGALISSYQVGVFLAGLVPTLMTGWAHSMGFVPWRVVFFLGILPALLAVVIRVQMKESDKWLAVQALQQTQDAQHGHGISWWQAFVQHELLPLRQLMKPEYRRYLWIGGGLFGFFLVSYWSSVVWIPTWIQDLLGPDRAHGVEKSIATQWHGAFALLGCISAGLLANGIGRRWTIVLGTTLAFFTTVWMTQSNAVFSEQIYYQDALIGLFTGMAQAASYVYLPELFPTAIRSTGVGFCLNMGRLFTAGVVLFMGPVVQALGGYGPAIAVFAIPHLLAGAVTLFGKETKGQGLPG